MAVLDNFDINANFWKVNPQAKIAFDNIYKNDKSKDKVESSTVMWAIALYVDNSKSNMYRNLSIEDRKDLITEEYLKNPKFDWKLYKEEIDLYKKLNLTKNQRNLLEIEDKLDQRGKVLNDEEYTIDNALDLDKIIINTKSVFEVHRLLKDAVDKEEADSTTRGGRVESASEKGLI